MFQKYQWGLVLTKWAGLVAFCFWTVLASHFILWSSEWLASIGTQNSDSVIDSPSSVYWFLNTVTLWVLAMTLSILFSSITIGYINATDT